MSSREVNNWLRTPFIDVQDAKSLYIKMIFSMRKCDKHQYPSLLQQCRETFNLYYYEADRDFANMEMPSWDGLSYTMIDKVAAKHLVENPDEYKFNTEVRTVSLHQGLQGIYFAFQDTGSCVTLMAIQVYYKICENTKKNYAIFPQTPTGKDVGTNVEVEGHCVPYADVVTKPTYRCMGDGTWDIPLGGCQCRSGYEGNDESFCTRKYHMLNKKVSEYHASR